MHTNQHTWCQCHAHAAQKQLRKALPRQFSATVHTHLHAFVQKCQRHDADVLIFALDSLFDESYTLRDPVTQKHCKKFVRVLFTFRDIVPKSTRYCSTGYQHMAEYHAGNQNKNRMTCNERWTHMSSFSMRICLIVRIASLNGGSVGPRDSLHAFFTAARIASVVRDFVNCWFNILHIVDRECDAPKNGNSLVFFSVPGMSELTVNHSLGFD